MILASWLAEGINGIIAVVLLWTRLPTPLRRGAGATDCRGKPCIWRLVLDFGTNVLLLAVAVHMEGVVTMLSTVVIEIAVHQAITVGSRVQSRTKKITFDGLTIRRNDNECSSA